MPHSITRCLGGLQRSPVLHGFRDLSYRSEHRDGLYGRSTRFDLLSEACDREVAVKDGQFQSLQSVIYIEQRMTECAPAVAKRIYNHVHWINSLIDIIPLGPEAICEAMRGDLKCSSNSFA